MVTQMLDKTAKNIEIRRLWWLDEAALVHHFLRLDAEGRESRFNGAVSDQVLHDYVHDLVRSDSLVWGAFARGVLRAVGEMRGLFNGWTQEDYVEVAFSVEPEFQNHGIASELLEYIMAFARNYGFRTLQLTFQRSNFAMYQIVHKNGAEITMDSDGYQAIIRLAPSPAAALGTSLYKTATVFRKPWNVWLSAT